MTAPDTPFPCQTPLLDLISKFVKIYIHHQGGTVLGSLCVGFNINRFCAFLKAKSISQLFVIGWDGMHRGAFKIHNICMERVGCVLAIKIFALCSVPFTSLTRWWALYGVMIWLIVSLSTIASQHSLTHEDTLNRTQHVLDYTAA